MQRLWDKVRCCMAGSVGWSGRVRFLLWMPLFCTWGDCSLVLSPGRWAFWLCLRDLSRADSEGRHVNFIWIREPAEAKWFGHLGQLCFLNVAQCGFPVANLWTVLSIDGNLGTDVWVFLQSECSVVTSKQQIVYSLSGAPSRCASCSHEREVSFCWCKETMRGGFLSFSLYYWSHWWNGNLQWSGRYAAECV